MKASTPCHHSFLDTWCSVNCQHHSNHAANWVPVSYCWGSTWQDKPYHKADEDVLAGSVWGVSRARGLDGETYSKVSVYESKQFIWMYACIILCMYIVYIIIYVYIYIFARFKNNIHEPYHAKAFGCRWLQSLVGNCLWCPGWYMHSLLSSLGLRPYLTPWISWKPPTFVSPLIFHTFRVWD